MTYETKFAPGDTAYTCSLDWDGAVKTTEYLVLEISIGTYGLRYVCGDMWYKNPGRRWDARKYLREEDLLTLDETKTFEIKALFERIANKETELAKLKKREEELLNGE